MAHDWDPSSAWDTPNDDSGWNAPSPWDASPQANSQPPSLIAFWLENVHAAQRGDNEQKLSEYLDRLGERAQGWGYERDPWGAIDEPWHSDHAGDGWGARPTDGGWGAADQPAWADTHLAQQCVDPGGWGSAAADEWDEARAGDAWDADPRDPSTPTKRPTPALASRASSVASNLRHSPDPRPTRQRQFVEAYARKTSASPSRKKDMISFYDLPTDTKIDKIQKLVYELHGSLKH